MADFLNYTTRLAGDIELNEEMHRNATFVIDLQEESVKAVRTIKAKPVHIHRDIHVICKAIF